MKTNVFFIGLLFSLFGCISMNAQAEEKKVSENVEGYEAIRKSKLEKLEKERSEFIENKKKALTKNIEKINEQVKTGALTEEQGDLQKNQLAEQYADVINAHNKVIDAQITYAGYQVTLDETKNKLSINNFNSNIKLRESIRTSSSLSVSFAYNFMNGENLDINDFSYANNNYFAIGYNFKTRLDNNNHIRLLYGVTYQSHGTELNGNRFITQGNQSQIADLGFNADKAKFRQDQLVFPLHFEFGGSNRIEYEDGRVRFIDDEYWKFGIGGFAGFNMSSRAKLKYRQNDTDIKETRINNFDNEKFLYGLDAYVGYDSVALFGRMNLNKVFEKNSLDAQYITFGIRFQD